MDGSRVRKTLNVVSTLSAASSYSYIVSIIFHAPAKFIPVEIQLKGDRKWRLY